MSTFASPAEFRAAWVAALRSGDYKQGQRVLRNGDKFCCLGVACDILDPTGWVPAPPLDVADYDLPESESKPFFFSYDGDLASLSDRIRGLLGVEFKLVGELMELNDEMGRSFNEIAAHIERAIGRR